VRQRRRQPSVTALIPVERAITHVRGHRVILASDLAGLYGVDARTLNQAVKRHAGRFPPDFAFRLTRKEATLIQRSRSQSGILKRGENIKYAPLAFTEHGAIMVASVLNSTRAVEMSVFVVRAFVRLRDLARRHVEFVGKVDALERRLDGHDEDLEQVFEALRWLTAPAQRPRRQIGFRSPAKTLATSLRSARS